MYAGGAEHPLREPCQRILRAIGAERLDAVISAEIVQEILHRFLAIGRPKVAREMAQAALDLFAPVVPVTHAVMGRMPDLVARYDRMTARDLIHVATCAEVGIETIVSPDRAFDRARGIRRLAPDDAAAIRALGG